MNLNFLNNTRRNLIIFLSVLTIFLILFFVYRKYVKEDIPERIFETTNTAMKTPDELKKIFPNGIDSIVSKFGIKKIWIKESNVQVSKPITKDKNNKKPVSKEKVINENLWFSKYIDVPKDVSISEINFEIKNFLNDYEFDCLGIEDPKSGNVTINIYNLKDTSRKTIAQVNIQYSDKIHREAADVCIVINNLDKYAKSDLEKLLDYPDNFTVVLPDMIDKIESQAIVLDSKREYILLFDIGDNDDLMAEFKPEMKEKEWKSKVRTTSYEFDKAAGVVIMNPKKISPLESDILNEFPKYNLRSFRDTIFVRFSSEESPELKIQAFNNDIISRTQKGARSLIYLVNFDLKDYEKFRSESYKLKRKGFRFYGFSDINKRRQKQITMEQQE